MNIVSYIAKGFLREAVRSAYKETNASNNILVKIIFVLFETAGIYIMLLTVLLFLLFSGALVNGAIAKYLPWIASGFFFAVRLYFRMIKEESVGENLEE